MGAVNLFASTLQPSQSSFNPLKIPLNLLLIPAKLYRSQANLSNLFLIELEITRRW